mgnify:CR=1 FL=1
MKITLEQQEKGRELQQELVQKAWENATFKEQLIHNPKATIAEVTGVKINSADDFKLVVEDQTDNNIIYLNIPRKIDIDDIELTEEQLKMVSGGVLGVLAIIAIGAAVGAAAYGLGYLAGRYL